MKLSKEQIIEKAKIIMKDLKGKFYTDSCIDDAFLGKKSRFTLVSIMDKSCRVG